MIHADNCAIHGGPTRSPKPCDCGAAPLLERIAIFHGKIVDWRKNEEHLPAAATIATALDLLAECAITLRHNDADADWCKGYDQGRIDAAGNDKPPLTESGLVERVTQYLAGELPGQPLARHMGTSYLINDLAARISELEAEFAQLDKDWHRVVHERDAIRDQYPALRESIVNLQNINAKRDAEIARLQAPVTDAEVEASLDCLAKRSILYVTDESMRAALEAARNVRRKA